MSHIDANQGYYPQKVKAKSKVLLSCGHWVKVRTHPFPAATLGCTAGIGCGYNLSWVTYQEESGLIWENRKYNP